MDESALACPKCGAPTGVKARGTIQEKDLAICVILSIITCGIYAIYWFITMTDDSKTLYDDNTAGGALAFVYTLLSCGIYSIYWNYKIGKRMYEAGKNAGVNISDNSVLYLILSIFGLSIITYCLVQSDLNRLANQ